MRQPHTGQKMHTEQTHAQNLGAKSGWAMLLPVLSWVLVLSAAVAAFVGSGQYPWAAAAGGMSGVGATGTNGGETATSEAALGARHGQRRQSGCALIVPRHPLTAAGLATPYQLTGNVAGGGPCHEANSAVAAFVQAAALDPATGQIAIYNPLVIDQGTRPAVAPVVPALPANAVVAIWFGSNGTSLRLQGADFATLTDGRCVDGLGPWVFGQVAYCNAPTFFAAANRLIQQKTLTPPALGTAHDGMLCPTVRDFSVVDQDQSDNVTTTYRITQDGRMAQDTAANATRFPTSVVLKNGSDNGLLAGPLDAALGCAPWKAPDLANPGQVVSALPLDELQAATYQPAPAALVPGNDPMTLVNGHPNLVKQNLYRAGVDQPFERSSAQSQADNLAYCQNILRIAPARLQADRAWTEAATSPDPAVANSLFTFLASRLSVTFGPDELNCTGLLHVANPVHLTEQNGVVVDATLSAPTQQASAGA